MLSGDAPLGSAFFNGCASDEEHRADEHKRCADHQDIERVGHSHTCLLRVYTKIICMFCVAWKGGRGATSPPMTPSRPDALRQGNEKTSLLGVQIFCRKSQKESRPEAAFDVSAENQSALRSACVGQPSAGMPRRSCSFCTAIRVPEPRMPSIFPTSWVMASSLV